MTEKILITGDHRALRLTFSLFLMLGLLIALISMTFAPQIPYSSALIIRILIILVLLLSSVYLRRKEKQRDFASGIFAFFIASSALFLSWQFGSLLPGWLHLTTDTPQGIALTKLSESAIIVITILALNRLSGASFSSLYLQKGRLLFGLVIGIVSFILLSLLAVLQTVGEGIGLSTILHWTPWILIFILANGFMEELLFRGLFLRKFEKFFNRRVSNILAAIIFTAAHTQVTYTPDLLIFLVVLFILACAWGWLIQKTDSIWGSALFHAGADTLIIVGIFASYGI